MSGEETVLLGSNDAGRDCGNKKRRVVMGLECCLLKIHPLYSQAVPFLRVLKDHEARPDHCENK